MGDVAQWLEELGLAKYADAFARHEIDFDALPHLTEGMLEQLGLPIGPRAKVLAALARLKSTLPASGTDAVLPLGAPPAPERRQITVMFCDLVDSTRLARRLDPEDLRAVMQTYQRTCALVVARYGGHIGQYLGDGIMVYFGWPTAHEDSAERAVRAGLEIIEAVRSVEAAEPLAVRVGISTGIVVISGGLSADPTVPAGAVGDTPHIAARLQALARPNTVVIAEATSRLVTAWFDQEPLGPQHLKGIVEPIHAFCVRRLREESSRFQAARAAELTPLVGRLPELALLQQRWREARDGEGQVVSIAGVPGIGKSRLVYELEDRIGTEPHFALRLQCLPHCMQSALHPVIRQLERIGNLRAADPDPVKLEKIEQRAAQLPCDAERCVPLLAHLLSVDCGARYAPLELTPQQLKARTFALLVELLVALARLRPVLLVVEDAQWIDPSTQEFLELALGAIEKAPVLLVITHRPEYELPPAARGNAAALTLSRLGRREVTEMAQLVLRERIASAALMAQLIDGSDAIPLFVEELARGIVESVAADRGETGQRERRSVSLTVPDSLRDSLLARLDRAPQGRSVAQIAAVLGREFSYATLRAVAGLPAAELDSTLAHLVRSDIIQLVDGFAAGRYAFKHALLRDAAYETLLKSRRRELHVAVAAMLERDRPDVVAEQPELLAYHASNGGNPRAAAMYWLRGGDRARKRSAYVEAIAQFEQALAALASLPEDGERAAAELELQLALGLCHVALNGYSAGATRKAFERALELSGPLGESGKAMQALFGLWGHHWMRAQHAEALALADRMLATAEALQTPVGLAVAHRSLGSTLFTLGDFERAREHLERAAESPAQASGDPLSFAVDPRIAARLMLAWALWILGHPDRSLAEVRRALEDARRSADPYTLAFAHYVHSAVHLLRGEWQESLHHAERSFEISREQRINLYALYSRFGRGCALARLGQGLEGLHEIRDGIAEARRSELGYMRAFMLAWYATVQAENGDAESALAALDQALAEVDDASGRAWEAELHRLRGELLAAARPEACADAELSLRRALEVAARQHAHGLELRAATSLARRLNGSARSSEGRALLAAAYERITEGADTADMRDARSVLASLE